MKIQPILFCILFMVLSGEGGVQIDENNSKSNDYKMRLL